MTREALGSDYAEAKRRCDELLNSQFDEWRTKDEAPARRAAEDRPAGLARRPLQDEPALRANHRKRAGYDAALKLVSSYKLKDQRTFGSLALASITPGAADLFMRNYVSSTSRRLAPMGRRCCTEDGTPLLRARERSRTALLAMQVCRRAWFVAQRDKPSLVPAHNPFAKMELSYTPKATRPVGYDPLMKFVAAADQAGESSIGTAAMIAFFWLQRETDIIGRLTWQHYRPGRRRLTSHGSGITRQDSSSTCRSTMTMAPCSGPSLWTPRYGAADRHADRHAGCAGSPAQNSSSWKEDYFRHRAAALRAKAGLHPDEKFIGLRHGGYTEGADAELSDAQLRALAAVSCGDGSRVREGHDAAAARGCSEAFGGENEAGELSE